MSIGLSIGLSLRGQYLSGGFDPATLFASGEEGAWFEPSTSTAFLSATDLTPCAVGDECGFLLDKSQGAGYSGGSFTGLGSEEAPALSTYATVLTGTWSDAGGGAYSFEDTVGGQTRPGVQWASSGLVSGTLYLASISVDSITGAAQLRVDGVGSDVLIGAGAHDFVFTADATSASQGLRVRIEDVSTTLGDGFTISSISVRELPGNHATQATLASRPILRQTGGGLYYLEFDGTDDFLSVTTPALTLANLSFWIGSQETVQTNNAGFVVLAPSAGSDFNQTDAVATESGGTSDIFVFIADTNSPRCAITGTGATPLAVYEAYKTGTTLAEVIKDGGTPVTDNTIPGLDATHSGDLLLGCRYVSSTQSNFLDGNMFSVIVRCATSTNSERTDARQYVADKTGVTL